GERQVGLGIGRDCVRRIASGEDVPGVAQTMWRFALRGEAADVAIHQTDCAALPPRNMIPVTPTCPPEPGVGQVVPHALDRTWQGPLEPDLGDLQEDGSWVLRLAQVTCPIAGIEFLLVSVLDELPIDRPGDCVEERMPAAGKSNNLRQRGI